MSLFKKKPKPDPTVTVDGVTFVYRLKHDWWEFSFSGVDFVVFTTSLNPPSSEDIEDLLRQVNALKPEMQRRLAKGWADWEGVKMDDGESFSINISDLRADGSFVVTWADGETWGDMGIDFRIKNGEILDEAWGD